ncbi:alkaline phosphatase D family protein [Micromonospora siamensis]|uniref:Alkaline phosphatase D n=1 Tax=Micromonospora siamensis TaxID=299152 RepID=A0A1C5IRK4_9ACTN|nr:alkaline phosphatase D family protein [Micromonospora siamensis]SCG60609.1 alkaline phosphatase D [Micromonospora siamensis]
MGEQIEQRGIGRRNLLVGAAALTGTAAVTGSVTPAYAQGLSWNPFRLGVASGDPLPDGVVLWTRLVRDPLDAASMGSRPVQVTWQIAADPSFRRVVRAGAVTARPGWAHSVHVDVRGLQPGRDYWYRFRAGRHLSEIGRTRTAPERGAVASRLRFGIANCQDWQNGYYPAYRDMAECDLDLVLHLGDYIYEYDPKPGAVRQHNPSSGTPLDADQLSTLADFRNRHALYRTDPQLQAAHRAFPFVAVWDDHETENNYAGLDDEQDDLPYPQRHQARQEFAVQRAHAYQAWYEHTPVRAAYLPGSPDLRIYRRFDFGTLLRLNMLDTRQYRTDQPGGIPTDFGPQALGSTNTNGTLTGPAQEAWLVDGLRSSPALWNVLGQQVMMAATRFVTPPPASTVNLDQWDGYSPQRARLLAAVRASGAANPIVLAGDIHSTWVSDLKLDFDDAASPVVASEFVATSITSDFPAELVPVVEASNRAFNPWVRYFNGRTHGWLRMDVDRSRWLTEERSVAAVDSPDAPASTTGRWIVEAGSPGVQPA